MGLNAKKVKSEAKGFKQPPLEAGSYPARLVQLIDLGVQKQRDFKGQPKDPVHMIYTTYELVDEFCVTEEGDVQEDKPRWLSEDFGFYNLEVDRATSTKRYNALDPKVEKDGDWTKLLGTPVLVQVTYTPGKGKHDGKVFNNIGGTSAMRTKEASQLVELKNPTKLFMLDDPDVDVFMSLPNWLQEKIKENLDFDGSDLEDAISNYKAPEDGDDTKEDVNKNSSSDDKDDNEEDW